MGVWRQIIRGLKALTHRDAVDRDVCDEVSHYLAEAAAELEARGLSAEDARRQASLTLGNPTIAREGVRAYGWENVVEATAADAKYGLRRLTRSPGFAFVCALTLALGIGASTAIFSAVNPVLLQPLPYPNADRLAMIWDGPDRARADVTFGTFREVVHRSTSFDALAVSRPIQGTLTGGTEPERLNGQAVSAMYLQVLGVAPAVGRDFLQSDDLPGVPVVVLLSDGLWRRRFGADPAIVGRQISLSDRPVLVIGVMPSGFEDVLGPSADFWSPLRYNPSLPLDGPEWGHHLRMAGRLKPNLDISRARLELAGIAEHGVTGFARPPWASLSEGLIAVNLQDDLTRSTRPVLAAIFGAVGLLLTIACVNVTNLLLARGAERRGEFTLRAALGGSRIRLVRQLLTETLLLAGAGGLLGVAVASVAVDAIVALSPPQLPRAGAIALDATVVWFAVILTTTVGVLMGIVPAIQGSRGALQGSPRVAGGPHHTRRALVVVQVALAFVLLVGAGLLVRSLERLFAVPAGFNATELLTMQVQASGQRFRDADATHQFFDEALEAVRRVPGVSASAFVSQLPLSGDEDLWGIHFESGARLGPEEGSDGYRYAVSPDYFPTMAIPLRQGRWLSARDTADAPLAAVINESFARRRLAGSDPIGQRLRVGPSDSAPFTIVGVVGDVAQASLALGGADAVYMTNAQWRFADTGRWLVVRAERDAAGLTPAIKRAIWSIDPHQPIVKVATMQERLAMSAADRGFALVLFQAFGLVALVLAAVGTYSLLSGNVAERTREIGVRSALGASGREIVAMVVRQGMSLAGIGIVLGLGGAALASRSIDSLLFGVTRLDFATYLGVGLLLAAVSALACVLPAWRAALIRPSIALRAD